MDGEAGAQTWCGWGLLAHNSTKIGALTTAARDDPSRHDHHQARQRPPGSDPPAVSGRTRAA